MQFCGCFVMPALFFFPFLFFQFLCLRGRERKSRYAWHLKINNLFWLDDLLGFMWSRVSGSISLNEQRAAVQFPDETSDCLTFMCGCTTPTLLQRKFKLSQGGCAGMWLLCLDRNEQLLAGSHGSWNARWRSVCVMRWMRWSAGGGRLEVHVLHQQPTWVNVFSSGADHREKKYKAHRQFGDRRGGVISARTYFYADEAKCDKQMETFINCIKASGNGFAVAVVTFKEIF